MFSGGFMQMQSHGSFEVTIIDQTLTVKAFGAWNYETALSYGEEFKQLACKLRNKPWACLLDLTEWELFTSDSWDYLNELNEWCNINNQKYEVIICSSPTQKALLEKTHVLLPNVEARFFDDFENAYKWLKHVGVLKT